MSLESLRYTPDHEWVALEGDLATVGITARAQAALGELVFIELPTPGATVRKGKVVAVVESVKAASDVYAPLSGAIHSVNAAVAERPALVNEDPTGAGWLFKLRITETVELAALLDASAYEGLP